MNEHQLFFSADEVRAALRELGPTGTRAEATVAIAAETLASMIDFSDLVPEFDADDEEGDELVWVVELWLGSDAARQAGRPHVVIRRTSRLLAEEKL